MTVKNILTSSFKCQQLKMALKNYIAKSPYLEKGSKKVLHITTPS